MQKPSKRNYDIISVIIPALNEEEGIKKTIESIPTKLLLKQGFKTEIIVIDNNSIDKTSEISKKMGAKVYIEEKRGYGRAYLKGFSKASGSIIITADADCTYPLADIPELLRYFKKNKLEFLTTNRFKTGYWNLETMSTTSKIGNLILSLLFRIIYRVNIIDSQSGMWILNKDLIEKMKLRGKQMNFSQEIKIEAIYYLKSNWDEIKISYSERSGISKLNYYKNGFENFYYLIEKRTRR